MTNLYEISQNYLDTFEKLTDENLTSDDIENLLKIEEEQKENLEEKCLNYVKYIKSLEFDIEARKSEIKRLQDFNKVDENKIKRLKKSLFDVISIFGKLDLKLFKLSIRNNPISVKIDDDIDIENLESKFIKTKIIKEIDKKNIKEYIEQGNIINGITLEQTQTLLIK